MFANIWNWLVVSSSDPYKFSLTLKAGAATIISVLTIALGLAHIAVGGPDLTAISDSVIAVIQDLVVLVGALATVYGLIRKIIASVEGTHAGINAQPGTGLTLAP